MAHHPPLRRCDALCAEPRLRRARRRWQKRAEYPKCLFHAYARSVSRRGAVVPSAMSGHAARSTVFAYLPKSVSIDREHCGLAHNPCKSSPCAPRREASRHGTRIAYSYASVGAPAWLLCA